MWMLTDGGTSSVYVLFSSRHEFHILFISIYIDFQAYDFCCVVFELSSLTLWINCTTMTTTI